MLFIGGFPPPGSPIKGGIVTSCRLLLDSAFAERFELVLLDSTQRSIPEPGPLTRARLAAARVARFVWLLERHQPQAVLAFSSQGASFLEKSLCALYARARGVPTVLLMRGGPFMDDVRRSRAYRALARTLLRVPAAIACQGETWRRFFRDELAVDDARLPVVHNWTARSDYMAIPRPVEPAPGRPMRILFMAWMDAAKGIFELLDAAAALRASDAAPPLELHYAGGGAHLEQLRARVAAEGLGDWVLLHGWVEGAAKAALYQSADVFVLPSYAEGMPNSMIEAMSSGLPVVVTPVGSVPDVIRNGENGLLVPARDAPALREALARLLASPALRRELGEAARRTARDTFGLERGVRDLETAVLTAMATRGGAAAAAPR